MSKLYYDDPLEVAIMFRNFGVNFIVYPTKEQISEYDNDKPWDWMHSCVEDGGCEVDTIEDALNWIKEATGKAYVRQDSEELFKPKHGDFDNEGFSYSSNTNEWVNAACQTKEHSIIYIRDGKTFFMPKKEEI